MKKKSSYSCLICFSEKVQPAVVMKSRRTDPLEQRNLLWSREWLSWFQSITGIFKLTFFFPAAFRAAVLLSMSKTCREKCFLASKLQTINCWKTTWQMATSKEKNPKDVNMSVSLQSCMGHVMSLKWPTMREENQSVLKLTTGPPTSLSAFWTLVAVRATTSSSSDSSESVVPPKWFLALCSSFRSFTSSSKDWLAAMYTWTGNSHTWVTWPDAAVTPTGLCIAACAHTHRQPHSHTQIDTHSLTHRDTRTLTHRHTLIYTHSLTHTHWSMF